MTRRDVLRVTGTGFGMAALAQLLAENNAAPLSRKEPHFKPRAKHAIFLFLNGGPSQVDTFDPKPMLTKYDGKPMPGAQQVISGGGIHLNVGNLMGSPFSFKKYGQSGIEVSELFPRTGELIDDVCVVRSMYTDVPNHPPGLFMMNSGHNLAGRPALGSWLTYGLGTENQNLPGFVVLSPGFPVMGPQLWTSAFLPASHQGTYVQNNEQDPQKLIPFLRNAKSDPTVQRGQLDLLAKLNRLQLKKTGPAPQLEATIHSMETAYRMQAEAMDAFDIRKESEETRQQYGDTDFGRGCLMARRLVERGVRMTQVYYGESQPWDSHSDIQDHRKHARSADPAIAALLRDLKARGLLSETIVLIGGEFGRTPSVQPEGSAGRLANGRHHNSYGFTMLLAGGGVKGGFIYGATDEFGLRAIEKPVHPHDLHATVLHLFGLDHTKLTYRYSGRDFRLTDVAGNVIQEILA